MSASMTAFVGAVFFSVLPAAQAFVCPITRCTLAPRTSGPAHTAASSPRVAPEDTHTPRYPPLAARVHQPLWGRLNALSAESTGGGSGDAEEGSVTSDATDEDGIAPARKPAEPVGRSGAMEDDMLIELVGQDYGMMALLRNDKFKSLIVLLRNVPPNEWVAEVARTYPDDDEVKGMLGQVGKLMKMMDYYMAKKPKK